MFFFLSKLLYPFLNPSNWLIILLLLTLLVKSRAVKKRLIIVTVVIFFVFSNEFIFVKLANAWQPSPVNILADVTYDAGIMLGGIVSFDKNNNGFLNGASDRFFQIYQLYKTGKIKKIIISGGALYKYLPPEADYLEQKLLELGVPQQDIIKENGSRTTIENANYTKKLLHSLSLKQPLVLVTSAMHMRRATMAFNKAGIRTVPYPCNYTILDKRMGITDIIIPEISVLGQWFSFLKEIVGVVVYKIL